MMRFAKLLAYVTQHHIGHKSSEKVSPPSLPLDAWEDSLQTSEKIAELERFFEKSFQATHIGQRDLIELMGSVLESLKQTLRFEVNTHQPAAVSLPGTVLKRANLPSMTQTFAQILTTFRSPKATSEPSFQQHLIPREEIFAWYERYAYLDSMTAARQHAIDKNIALFEYMLHNMPSHPSPVLLQDITNVATIMFQNNRILNLQPSEQLLHLGYLQSMDETLNARILVLQKKEKIDTVKFALKMIGGCIVATAIVATIVCIATPAVPLMLALSASALIWASVEGGASLIAAITAVTLGSMKIRSLVRKDDYSLTLNKAMQHNLRLFASQVDRRPPPSAEKLTVLVPVP